MTDPTIENPTTELGAWSTPDGGRTWTLETPSDLFDALRTGVRQEDGSVVFDNGDGTGTRTTYDAEGNVTSTEELTDLPIPAEPEPTVEEQLAELQALLDALLGEGE